MDVSNGECDIYDEREQEHTVRIHVSFPKERFKLGTVNIPGHCLKQTRSKTRHIHKVTAVKPDGRSWNNKR